MDFQRHLATILVGNQYPSIQMSGTAGGTFTLSVNDISLYGDAWSIMKLSKYHIFDVYSRLKLSFSVTADVIFLGLCFMTDISDYRSCLQIDGTAEGDLLDDNLPSSARFYNLALGKPTIQSPPVVSDRNLGSAVDGRFDGIVSSSLEKDPWWEVDLEGLFAIDQVCLYMGVVGDDIIDSTNSTSDSLFSDMIVQLFDDNGNVVFRSNIAQPSQYKNIINIPHGTKASKVRVQFRGDEKALVFTEVQITELIFQPAIDVNVPIGTLFGGKRINYVSFIQKGVQKDNGRGNRTVIGESYVSRLTLKNGYNPQ